MTVTRAFVNRSRHFEKVTAERATRQVQLDTLWEQLEGPMSHPEGRRDFVRVVLCYFIPPVGVFMQVGLGSAFWINLLLTFFGYLPGVLHGVWIISSVREGGGQASDANSTFFSLLAGYFLPPVGVAMRRGVSAALVINIVLTLLFWVPGMVHAAWVICNAED